MRRPRWAPPLLAVLAVGLAVSGCRGSSGSGAAEGPAEVKTPAGLSVSVLQYRDDYVIRRMQIKITNAGATPVRVVAARLSSAAFTADTVWQSRDAADEATIGPGAATDLRALLPATECSGRPALTGTVRLDLRRPDGTVARTPAVPAGDPFDSIPKVHADDCRSVGALAVAAITPGPLRTRTTDGQLVGLLDLTLAPTGRPGSLTVQTIAPTTLLRPRTGAVWQLDETVTATDRPRTVVLELRPARCDPHAIAEDKLGTVLPLTLRVDDGESGVVAVASDPGLRADIQNYVSAACGPG